MTLLITGGAGFIGSNFIIDWFKNYSENIVNIDKLTYAGNLENLLSVNNKNYKFEHGDISDANFIKKILNKYSPRVIINFAAESHVDRSILQPSNFVNTNVLGTFNLLESTRFYWNKLEKSKKRKFRFIHISTDEVYGDLSRNEKPFSETSKIKPNSPYSASKAASDHFVQAWNNTYGLPVITANCSNNYGPFQFPEKLIPLLVVNALSGNFLPIYGDGKQIRDWLFVKDHCLAIRLLIKKGKVGEVYNIGGGNEKTNLEVANDICTILNELSPRVDGKSYETLIKFVKDRPGHDRRYAINSKKIKTELNWRPRENFKTGLKKTIKWYLNNIDWVKNIQTGEYRKWIKKQYGTNR